MHTRTCPCPGIAGHPWAGPHRKPGPHAAGRQLCPGGRRAAEGWSLGGCLKQWREVGGSVHIGGVPGPHIHTSHPHPHPHTGHPLDNCSKIWFGLVCSFVCFLGHLRKKHKSSRPVGGQGTPRPVGGRFTEHDVSKWNTGPHHPPLGTSRAVSGMLFIANMSSFSRRHPPSAHSLGGCK